MITKTKPAVNRFVRLVEPWDQGSALIEITVGKKSGQYWLDQYPSEYGRAFVLTKKERPANPAEDVVYRLCIDNEQDHHCECPGHQHHGHCKHVSAVLALLKLGKI